MRYADRAEKVEAWLGRLDEFIASQAQRLAKDFRLDARHKESLIRVLRETAYISISGSIHPAYPDDDNQFDYLCRHLDFLADPFKFFPTIEEIRDAIIANGIENAIPLFLKGRIREYSTLYYELLANESRLRSHDDLRADLKAFSNYLQRYRDTLLNDGRGPADQDLPAWIRKTLMHLYPADRRVPKADKELLDRKQMFKLKFEIIRLFQRSEDPQTVASNIPGVLRNFAPTGWRAAYFFNLDRLFIGLGLAQQDRKFGFDLIHPGGLTDILDTAWDLLNEFETGSNADFFESLKPVLDLSGRHPVFKKRSYFKLSEEEHEIIDPVLEAMEKAKFSQTPNHDWREFHEMVSESLALDRVQAPSDRGIRWIGYTPVRQLIRSLRRQHFIHSPTYRWVGIVRRHGIEEFYPTPTQAKVIRVLHQARQQDKLPSLDEQSILDAIGKPDGELKNILRRQAREKGGWEPSPIVGRLIIEDPNGIYKLNI